MNGAPTVAMINDRMMFVVLGGRPGQSSRPSMVDHLSESERVPSECGNADSQRFEAGCVDAVAGPRAFDFTLNEPCFAKDP